MGKMDKEARKELFAKAERGEKLRPSERKRLGREKYKIKRNENRSNNRRMKRWEESIKKKEEKLRKMEMGPLAYAEYVAKKQFDRYHWTKNNDDSACAQRRQPAVLPSGSNTAVQYFPSKNMQTFSPAPEGLDTIIRAKKNKAKSKRLQKERKSKKKAKLDEQDFAEDVQFNESADIPLELMNAPKNMTPMTKEEWDAKQSVVKRVLDEESGRYRLIKGDGEVLEEIVSRDRHKEINRQATNADGAFFQSQTVAKRI